MQNMNIRLKDLRKRLNVNQSEFGTKIGLKQGTISDMEQGRTSVTEQTIKTICREFGVSEAWLRTGAGEMFSPNESNYLDALIDKYGLSQESAAFIKIYCEMSETERLALCGLCVRYASQVEALHSSPEPVKNDEPSCQKKTG